MKLREPGNALFQAGIRRDAFSLKGGHDPEQYVIHQDASGRWRTYYSEKGLESPLRLFNGEDDACVHFFKLLVSDESTHLKR